MQQAIERAGYSWLIDALDLRCVPLDRECVIGSRPALSQSTANATIEVFTKGYAREHRPVDQMLFALSYEGVNIGVLERAFQIPAVRNDLAAAILDKPASGYLRRLWYICEHIAGHLLPLPTQPRTFLMSTCFHLRNISPARRTCRAGIACG